MKLAFEMRVLGILVFALSLSAGLHAQVLEGGRVFTQHHVKVKLREGISEQQFVDFMTGEFLPAWEEHYEGVEAVLLKGIRGELEDEYSWINYYASEEKLREFYPEPGKTSAKAEAAAEKMKPWEKRLKDYGTLRYVDYTTWIVQ